MFDNRIFKGEIRHRRFKPKQHHFSYKLFMFFFDIGDLHNSFKDIKQVSIETFNWFAFYRKNYLTHPEIPLDEYVRQLVVAKFQTYPQGKIYLLTHLSCLGYCFNPISLYFIFNESNQHLDYLIIEVSNTPWGEKHNYVLASSASRSKEELYGFQFHKELHVSPFMTMNYEYKFNLKLENNKIIVHMENHIDGKKDFDATLSLIASDQKATSLKNVFIQYPLITYKVAAAIYWEAFKLWLKGVPFHSHPKTDKKD